LALGLSVRDNAILASIERFTKRLFMDHRKTEENAQKYVGLLSIKTPSTAQLVKNLSGGNQQKTVLAKWLTRDCDILIFDEPTRGIDVGAKSEIYALMNELVGMGKSIIMISSEMPELLRMADRIVVMCEGAVTGELSIEEATQEAIMTLATMTMK
jgi:ribose transport system ATP-binding protein